jgi:hypothetical protein
LKWEDVNAGPKSAVIAALRTLRRKNAIEGSDAIAEACDAAIAKLEEKPKKKRSKQQGLF